MPDEPSIDYRFLAPRLVRFGWGARTEIGELAASLGRRAFLVVGSRSLEAAGAVEEISTLLQRADIETVVAARIAREPLVEDVDRATAEMISRGASAGDFVLALGGGSAIDLAKAAAAMATNGDASTSVCDYLEGVGTGRSVERPPLPMLAMPTTAGTGSEATKNAVISGRHPDTGEPFKKSLRSDRMVPRVVLIDPELAVGLPPNVTAWTGMDAVTQLIESFLSRRAQPIPSALAVEGLRHALGALGTAVRDGSSRSSREAMAHAAFLSGMALANSGLGMAHGVAAALGVHCDVPHGLACAVMLPVALRANFAFSRSRLAELARTVLRVADGDEAHAANAFVDRVVTLCREVGVPRRLGDLGVQSEQLPALARGSRGNSMRGNPRDLDDGELARMLEEML